MVIKRFFITPVFVLFFALFGGVVYADNDTECPRSIPLRELDESLEIDSGSVGDISNPDWVVYFNDNKTLYGTSFCSDRDEGATTPGEEPGSLCWCGLTGYYDGQQTSSPNTTTWWFSVDLGESCDTDCASTCSVNFTDASERIAENVGLCEDFFEECTNPVPVSNLDGDFDEVCRVRPEDWRTNGINWEYVLSGGKTLQGFAFCSHTSDGDNATPSTLVGPHCWCGLKSYNDGSTTFEPGVITWKYGSVTNSTADCEQTCSDICYGVIDGDTCDFAASVGICDTSTTYNVTYVCGNGTSIPDPTGYFPGNNVTALGAGRCGTPPNGYSAFNNWSCNNNVGTVSGGGTFTMPATDVTCTAQWTPNIYTIRLRNYTNTSTHSTIYEKYNTGWYKNAAATQVLSQASRPTRSGYTFRGFYTTTQYDLNASGGSGTRVITQTGGLPANNTYTADTDLYAAWALNCSTGTGCNCTLNINSDGTVTYATSAQRGYTLTSGSGTYAPVCSAIDYTVSFVRGNGGASGSMSSFNNKHVGDTITLPANGFTAPSGYVFNGWSCDNSIGDKAVNDTFTMPAANVTCTAQWAQQITYPFTLTTTSLSANSTFQFTMSAQGTFYVDCGDGGILSGSSGSGVSGDTITKSDTNEYTYTCTYSSAGAKTIQFGGAATGYSDSPSVSVIRFTSPTLVDAISGDLSQIFPESVSSGSSIPRFVSTFEGCSNLVSIPDTLFSQYTKTGQYMFWYTFKDCTGLGTSNNPGVVPITAGLFSGITGFYTSVPQAGFFYTFQGCTGLTSIPKDLFLGIRNSASVARNTFSSTFQGCTGLTSIPKELFSGITTAGIASFSSTFQGCTGLTSIPEELFSSITTVAQSLFSSTFQGCTGLTSIPSGLFGNISGAPAQYMFASTFSGCSNLSGFGNKTYVPGDFLANINTNTSVSDQTTNMFSGTQLNNPCPANTYASTRQQFNNAGKPWCTECPSGTTSPAGSTSASQCVVPFTVTYTCGSGVSGTAPTDTNSYTPNSTVHTVESFGTCSKDGYYASGWVCDGTSVTSGGTFTITANTTCVAQWTGNGISLTWDGGGTPSSCTYGGTFVPPAPAARTGYVFTGWKLRNCFQSLDASISSTATYYYSITNTCCINTACTSGYCSDANFSDLNTGDWKVFFDYGTVVGTSICSETSGTSGTVGTPSATSGSYCWCAATDYTSSDSTQQCSVNNPIWVSRGTVDNCANNCAYRCAGNVKSQSGFRTVLFGQS